METARGILKKHQRNRSGTYISIFFITTAPHPHGVEREERLVPFDDCVVNHRGGRGTHVRQGTLRALLGSLGNEHQAREQCCCGWSCVKWANAARWGI
jgi:hypothetical protein